MFDTFQLIINTSMPLQKGSRPWHEWILFTTTMAQWLQTIPVELSTVYDVFQRTTKLIFSVYKEEWKILNKMKRKEKLSAFFFSLFITDF